GRDYKIDKNNIAPRFGIFYALRDGKLPTVIRGSLGLYYDTVYLSMYESSIQGNGTGRYLSVSRNPATQSATSPLFPNVIPQGTTLEQLGITQTADLISQDLRNM